MLRTSSLALAAVVALASVHSGESHPLTPAEADLGALVTLLSGEFDSSGQVAAERAAGVEPPHPRLHVLFAPVDAPEVGAHVLFTRQSTGTGPASVYRRRVLTFEPDSATGEVVMRSWGLPADVPAADDTSQVGWHGLTRDQLEPLAGCDVRWRRDGQSYAGSSSDGGCRLAGQPGGVQVTVHTEMTLSPTELELTEWATGPDGTTVWGRPDAGPVRLVRCRTFTGWLSWRDPAEPDEDAVQGSVRLSDQGGSMVVVDRDGTPTGLELELTRVAASADGADALVLTLRRQTGDNWKTEGTSWSGSEAEVIGLDLGWFRTGLATADTPPHPRPDLDLLLSWMAGSFSSAAQAAADPDFADIRLHMMPIWTWRTDARWLYVEQAAASALETPYRQRVYRVAEVADGLFESRVLELADPSRFVGAWQDAGRFDSLNPDMLTPRPGCAILLRRSGDRFIGSTLGSLCSSSLRGASFATSEVTITSSGLTSWDRGWAADGSQVWGAVKAGYRFERSHE